MRSTRFAMVAALALATLTPSCRLFRRSPKQVPQAPPPPAQQAPAKPPVALPTPPEVAPQAPDLSQQPPQGPSGQLPPPPRRRTKPPRARETADTPVPEAPPPALPQLEQILTPEQRQEYSEEIERNIGVAQKTVEALQGRRLSRDQAAYLARVRAFIEQARQARATDLIRARNLAERASVLAEDLRKSMQ